MKRFGVKNSLILLLLFLVGCSRSPEDTDSIATPSSFECQRTKLEDQFIVHWKKGRPTLLREKNIDAFIKKNKDKIKLIEPNYLIQSNTINLPIPLPITSPLTTYSLTSSIRHTVKTEAAWRAGFMGQGMTVAVIDTGIAINHPHIRSRLAINEFEIMNAQDSVDNDNNGYVDDVYGWNFVNNSPIQDDEIGHGTAMAGLITGQADDKSSIHMAPKAKIMSIDFMNAQGGSEYHAHAALNYALSRNVQIINNSWSISCSELLKNDFNNLREANVIFVNASGNVPVDVYQRGIIPSSLNLPNTLNVGSVDERGQLSTFSGYGRTVNIFAPGEFIPTIYPSSGWEQSSPASGTSVSTAIVSGAAALLWSAFPEAKASDIVSLIVEGAAGEGNSPRVLDVRQSLILGKKKFKKKFPVDPIVIPVEPAPVDPIHPDPQPTEPIPVEPFDPNQPLPVDPNNPNPLPEPDAPADPDTPDEPEVPDEEWP